MVNDLPVNWQHDTLIFSIILECDSNVLLSVHPKTGVAPVTGDRWANVM